MDGQPDIAHTERLPFNLEAEQALLGALLYDNELLFKVSSFLEPEHFYDPVHGRIYDAIARLAPNGRLASPVTLKTHFEQDDGLAEIGGPAYLAELASSAASTINVGDYGRMIFDLYSLRGLIRIGQDMIGRAAGADIEDTPQDQVTDAEQALYELAESGKYEGGFKSFSQSLREAIDMASAAYERDGGLSGISAGLIDLDKKLGGLHPSDLIILAGRPSMGKSGLATNIAVNAARAHRAERGDDGVMKTVDGAIVALFSLEMSAEQLATRILSDFSGISSEKIRRGEIGQDEFLKVADAARELEALPLYIDETGGLSISALAARSRRLKRRHGLDMIVVDYLQLLTTSDRKSSDGRVQEVSAITQGLKALAKELNVPVLALSQLSRQVEAREDKRPQLSDLRESGSIEQDADVVMFIFREEYYLRRSEPRMGTEEYDQWQRDMAEVHGQAEVIIGKQRHGPIGTVKLSFTEQFIRFGNLDPHH
ncbi:MAG: replicative DNA helicase [Pseudomonadota bacterium]